MKKMIIGASLGNCVHVAGVAHFLDLAQDVGYETLMAGPAVGVDNVIKLVKKHSPDMVCLGYRLTPENVVPIVEELCEKSKTLEKQPTWIFGGTSPVAAVVSEIGFFDKIFDSSEDLDDCLAYLRGGEGVAEEELYEDKLIPRLKQKAPYPLLRHHFGLPSLDETIDGVSEIANAKVLDIVSLGIDQNTQQYYFHPQKRDPKMDGAGGVPVKTDEEFRRLKQATKSGNYPLIRCYSGTDDVISLAEVLSDTIDNAWCAVPLFWYNDLDGRGTRTLQQSMNDAHELVRWHAERGIPVELNEPHHWGLRDAHDVISVVAAWLSAYHAKKLGVEDYIAQYMFNVPNAMSFSMDLAKVLAQIEIAQDMISEDFNIWRQTRAGLPFLSGDLNLAKGQLAASTMLQMAVHPNIIHVVGYSEAEHAATPQVIVESTKIVRGVIRSCLTGQADPTKDEVVQNRKNELLKEARYLISFIKNTYAEFSEDPLFDPAVLSDCVRRGILDAPHIVKNDVYRGILQTRMVGGACVAYDVNAKKALSEKERINMLSTQGLLKNIGENLSVKVQNV